MQGKLLNLKANRSFYSMFVLYLTFWWRTCRVWYHDGLRSVSMKKLDDGKAAMVRAREIASIMGSGLNPLPPKSVRVRNCKGSVIDLFAPKYLSRAASKTKAIVSKDLTSSDRKKLLLDLARLKAARAKSLNKAWERANSISERSPSVPTVTISSSGE